MREERERMREKSERERENGNCEGRERTMSWKDEEEGDGVSRNLGRRCLLTQQLLLPSLSIDMLGLALRHNSLHHLFALFLSLALATLCWCCWRRGRSYHRRQELLPRRTISHTASPSAPSSPSSSAPATLTPAPSRLDPRTAALLPNLSYRTHAHSHTGEFSSVDVDEHHHEYRGKDDNEGCGGLGLLIKNSDCAICLSNFDPDTLVTVLPSCNHAYHPPCIHQWVQSHKDCPLCRTEISLLAVTAL